MRALITGAGGSIGSEIVRFLSRLNPEKIVLVGHSETPIYSLNQEIPRSIPVIADVRCLSRMREVFMEHEPTHVFHAAAMKHVPLAEQFPVEAVQTNIIGTRNVVIASEMVGASMVFISTDKAVYPSSVMGKTKRIAELYCATRERVRIVRLVNVVGSSGSVYPLFQRQIEQGGPVTVTHPDMARFFMSVEEAARLAVGAGIESRLNNLYVANAPERKIVDIAHELIGDKEIPITFAGLRPGEKLEERQFYEDEPKGPSTGVCFLSDIPSRDPVLLNQTITQLEKGDLSVLERFEYA